jgi:hypothetical protein
LDFVGNWELKPNEHLAYYELKVPKAWDTVLSQDAWGQIQQAYAIAISNTSQPKSDDSKTKAPIINSLLGVRFIRDRLERCRDKLHADIIADGQTGQESQSVQKANSFLKDMPSSTAHDKLKQVLQAVQLLFMYWRQSKEVFGGRVGDLLVLSPTPPSRRDSHDPKNQIYWHAPRIGFALLFVHNSDKCASKDSAKVITDFLTEALWEQHHLQTFSQFGDVSQGRIGEPKLADDFEGNISSKTINKLKDTVVSVVDHEDYAEAMLCSALHLVTDIASLAPTFVHEGHRYGVNFLLGSSYHTQVVGKEIGPLSEYILTLVKDKNELHCSYENEDAQKKRRSVFRNLIHDSFSFLDSADVAVMTYYVPGNPRMVELHSIVELPAEGLNSSTVQKFEVITGQYKHLFAICVGRNGKVWLIFNRRTLLEFTGAHWVSSFDEKGLIGELAEAFNGTSPLGFQGWRDKKAIEGFAKLLQRIAEAGIGGTFIIRAQAQAKTGSKQTKLGFVSEPPPFFWQKALKAALEEEPPALLQLARMDGAILIEVPNGGQDFEHRWQNAQVWPRRVLAEKCDLKQHEKTWKGSPWTGVDWHEYRSWGIRRASALAYAMARKGSELVVAISADGPIYFMSGTPPYVVKYPSSETT